MTTYDDKERTLAEWEQTLTQALQILDLEFDHERILDVARRCSQQMSADAGVLSAFMIGYAAGTVTTNGRDEASAAVEKAASTVLTVVEKDAQTQEREGWTGTAQ
ncbi:hypothetical protein E8P82_07390 [Arthrobacter echini]|uniref:DUF6457 domain-containing protein n=1 Tax=Arthrobacter echini TaxID=1529066 RepID=A0A4S5E5G7_9MICC|nr:DUF6457 domain-containing protein [Arthrobacter echini]THJ66754.1 hypothetical protein E8P82_07390 [Arthrobacter echini]